MYGVWRLIRKLETENHGQDYGDGPAPPPVNAPYRVSGDDGSSRQDGDKGR